MKETFSTIIFVLASVAFITLAVAGCTTVTHYDNNGNIVKVEKMTNFSRAMDGTNQKSQIILVKGVYADFEASATAGEGYTPGIKTKFANGKIGFVNAKDEAKFNNVSEVVGKFFADTLEIGADGIKSK